MTAIASRSRPPGVRLGLALLSSLALHALVLLVKWPAPVVPTAPEPLLVTLALPEIVAEPESADLTTLPEPPAMPDLPALPMLGMSKLAPLPVLPPPVAVPPAPTFTPSPPPPPPARVAKSTPSSKSADEYYPRAAIASGQQGRVVLLLLVNEGGRVLSAEVASSSGYGLLDAAALRAAAHLVKLPGGRRQVMFPVEFWLE